MNPYTVIVAFVLAMGLWFGGDHFGHARGVNEQKVADQGRFDQINAERTAQKAEAATKLATANAANLALMAERDTLKTTLETQRAKNRKVTDDLHQQLAGLGLRFRLPAQGAGAGGGGASAEGTAPGSPGHDAAAVIQLPAALAGDLRQLAYDADKVLDDYRECYPYAQQVR